MNQSVSSREISPHVRRAHRRLIDGNSLLVKASIVNRHRANAIEQNDLALARDAASIDLQQATLVADGRTILVQGVRNYARLTPTESAELAKARVAAHVESKFFDDSLKERERLAGLELQALRLSMSRLTQGEKLALSALVGPTRNMVVDTRQASLGLVL